GDGTEVQLGRKAPSVALEDEVAQAAEAIAQHRRDGYKRNRRHGRETHAGENQRHRERHFDAPQSLLGGVAQALRRLQYVGWDRVKTCGDVADEDDERVQDERDLYGENADPG